MWSQVRGRCVLMPTEIFIQFTAFRGDAVKRMVDVHCGSVDAFMICICRLHECLRDMCLVVATRSTHSGDVY